MMAGAIYAFIDPMGFAWYSGLDSVAIVEESEKGGDPLLDYEAAVTDFFSTEAILALVWVFTGGASALIFNFSAMIVVFSPGIIQLIIVVISFLFRNLQW
jgi:hypothetical protein